MVPIHLNNTDINIEDTGGESKLLPEHKTTLLQIARDSIEHNLYHNKPLAVSLDDYPAELQEKRASFVTLKTNRTLRGCIGVLEAIRALVDDVAYNAQAAAFNDPRFNPLSRSEFDQLDIHISILSPHSEVHFSSEQELIDQLRINIDGLLLEEGYHRGTFLPSVWESVADPTDFLRHLKVKAGLDPDYWSDSIRVYRYTTESFPEE